METLAVVTSGLAIVVVLLCLWLLREVRDDLLAFSDLMKVLHAGVNGAEGRICAETTSARESADATVAGLEELTKTLQGLAVAPKPGHPGSAADLSALPFGRAMAMRERLNTLESASLEGLLKRG